MAAILLKDITIDGSLKDILIQGSRISKIGEAGDSVGWEIYGNNGLLRDGCHPGVCQYAYPLPYVPYEGD